MIFRKRGKLLDDEKWSYDGDSVEVVDQFNYLGIVLHFTCKFSHAIKCISEQGRKACFAMKKSSKPLFLNQSSLLALFDTYVASVLFYGCEIWGFQKADLIEKIHLDFCKNFLKVKGCTSNIMIYFELGRYPLVHERTYRMMKYWFKLIKTDNCIMSTMYSEMKSSCKTFQELGLGYIWDNQDHLVESTMYYLSLIKQRIFDQALQNLYHQLNTSVKCGNLYRYLVEDLKTQQYLVKPIPDIYKTCITKLRLSSHILAIETGRYKKISRPNGIHPVKLQLFQEQYSLC
ncbi:uncharacterized protein LOC121391214 [Gigantopelta aegis]|uniref:uncharacterized protein LOC121391214 n=1 Tax=Gigantopelta aegis TaxID=1735272 RepID=UPI001B888300|nr:uncharacterized protein LOC121391214 [Gigantopelta aegis]